MPFNKLPYPFLFHLYIFFPLTHSLTLFSLSLVCVLQKIRAHVCRIFGMQSSVSSLHRSIHHKVRADFFAQNVLYMYVNSAYMCKI